MNQTLYVRSCYNIENFVNFYLDANQINRHEFPSIRKFVSSNDQIDSEGSAVDCK